MLSNLTNKIKFQIIRSLENYSLTVCNMLGGIRLMIFFRSQVASKLILQHKQNIDKKSAQESNFYRFVAESTIYYHFILSICVAKCISYYYRLHLFKNARRSNKNSSKISKQQEIFKVIIFIYLFILFPIFSGHNTVCQPILYSG